MTDPDLIKLLLQGGPVVPLVIGLVALYKGWLITRESRDREITAIREGHAGVVAGLERYIAELVSEREAQRRYIDRGYDIAEASADLATRRSLQRPPLNRSGDDDD